MVGGPSIPLSRKTVSDETFCAEINESLQIYYGY